MNDSLFTQKKKNKEKKSAGKVSVSIYMPKYHKYFLIIYSSSCYFQR